MLWLKRNLFLAVGGLVTFVLLAAGIYYMISSYGESKTIESELEATKEQIDNLSRKVPAPSDANIELVRGEVNRLTDSVTKMRALFNPVPSQKVIGKEFADLLAITVDELRKKAAQLNVGTPSQRYAFSFETQKDRLTFGRGSFPALPSQLAEVKTLVNILLDAKINKLVNIRRTPVSSEDEMARSTADYHEMKITMDPVTGMTTRPYQFEFECFSAELGTVLEHLSKSKYALQTKSVLVEPAAAPGPVGAPGMAPPPTAVAPGRPNLPYRRFPGQPAPTAVAPRTTGAAAAAAAAQDLQTVLTEKLVKVVLLVEVIEPGN